MGAPPSPRDVLTPLLQHFAHRPLLSNLRARIPHTHSRHPTHRLIKRACAPPFFLGSILHQRLPQSAASAPHARSVLSASLPHPPPPTPPHTHSILPAPYCPPPRPRRPPQRAALWFLHARAADDVCVCGCGCVRARATTTTITTTTTTTHPANTHKQTARVPHNVRRRSEASLTRWRRVLGAALLFLSLSPRRHQHPQTHSQRLSHIYRYLTPATRNHHSGLKSREEQHGRLLSLTHAQHAHAVL